MPLVSIITCAYNCEAFLSQCIESIIAQTLEDWELILIDDGSVDATATICDQYALTDDRIRVFHQENRGVAYTKNRGLSMARGEYVGFVDADDWIDAEMFRSLYDTAVTYGKDIALCGIVYEFDGYKNYLRNDGTKGAYNRANAIWKIWEDKEIKSYLSDKLFKRSILLDNLPLLTTAEDKAVLLQWAGNSNGIAYTNQAFYHYRQLSSSITHKQDIATHFDFILGTFHQYEAFSRIAKDNGFHHRCFLPRIYKILLKKGASELIRKSRKEDKAKTISLLHEIRELVFKVKQRHGMKMRCDNYLRYYVLSTSPQLYYYLIKKLL